MVNARTLVTRLSRRTAAAGRLPVTLSASQVRSHVSALVKLPSARNEPNPSYVKGSPERAKLEEALRRLQAQIPLTSDLSYNGRAQTTSESLDQPLPTEHATAFTSYPLATRAQVSEAIEAALQAKKKWQQTPFLDRAAIFLKAADLVSTKYRYEIMAATMLGQAKNMWQAEIDSAAELADFFRLNCNFAAEIMERQPPLETEGQWSRIDWRPLEGFVYAVSPFNFTAIGGNLAAGPAVLGNVVLWKPSPSSIYASSIVYKVLLEAGLPEGVIQFVPGDAEMVTDVVLSHREFSGLNFVGSSDVFRSLYDRIGREIGKRTYRDFPRIVGETSGKNFHLIHKSADVSNAVNHTIRGAFDYSGQKCSATSRVYVPQSLADEFLAGLACGTKEITVGSPTDQLETFMGPVIHRRSFDKIKGIIDEANKDQSLKLIAGGTYDESKGFFVQPTVYQAESPDHKLFNEEIFGPVLAVYVYPDNEWESTLEKVDESGGGFALTGAIFAQDREVIREAEDALRYAAGNFYINCKCTAAVVGQQPFGGGRASGTNDKAGSSNSLMRFASPRVIKEEFVPVESFLYPSNY